MPLMTIPEYAEHRGINQAAVERAVRQGWLKPAADGRINARAADRAWSRYLARPEKFRFPQRPAVSLDEVRERAAARVRIIQERAFVIPDRIAHRVAKEGNPLKVQRLLEREVQNALIDLADVMP